VSVPVVGLLSDWSTTSVTWHAHVMTDHRVTASLVIPRPLCGSPEAHPNSHEIKTGNWAHSHRNVVQGTVETLPHTSEVALPM